MRKNNYANGLLIVAFITFLSSGNRIFGQVFTQTFVHTGASQSFTVPSCVYSLTLDLRGAQGGWANDRVPANGPGGLGGRAVGVLTVTPGQILTLMVGGQGFTTGIGGFNGGGTAGTSTAGSGCYGGPAGGGGGATDIRWPGITLADRIIVAGGGGGAGRDYCNGSCQPCGCSGNGGCGGGFSGMPGLASFCSESSGWNGNLMNGAGFGSQTSGGAGGPGDNWSSSTGSFSGTAGSLGTGGTGGNGTYDVAGGGGGGGYYGGGGGGGAGSGSGVGGGGGGGGSSYVGTLTNTLTALCVNSGNGVAFISWQLGGAPLTIIATPTSICAGANSTLTGVGQVTYTWSSTSNNSSIVVTPVSTTVYSASATNSLGCTSSASISIQVDNFAPSISVVPSPTAVCPGQSVYIAATGANFYTISSGSVNSSFIPSGSNTYTITGTNGCGTATALTSVSVHPLPPVTASINNPTICLGNSAIVTTGGASAYVISGGIVSGVPFNPSTSAVITVTGTSALGCTATAVTAVTVYPFAGPVVSTVPGNTAICSGTTLNINSAGVSTYTWNSGSNSNAISVSPSSLTNYTVQGTNSLGCISTAIISVSVDPGAPTLALTTSTTQVCPNRTVSIIASGATTYTFSGGISNGIPFIPVSSGTYAISGFNSCGNSSSIVSITVHPVPSVSAGISSPTVCSGDLIGVSGYGAVFYTWSSNVPGNFPFAPTSTSNFTVVGTSAFGCTASAVTGVTVIATPTLSPFASPPLICLGSSATLSAIAPSYTWYPGGPSNANFIVSPGSSTTYTVIKANGVCTHTSTINITVNSLPTLFAIANPTVICASNTTTLQGAGALTYSWTSGPGFTVTGTSPVVSPAITTIYTLTASDGTCINTTTVLVAANPNPTVTLLVSPQIICSGKSSTLTAGGGVGYTWSPASLSGTVAVVTPTGNILVTVTGTNSFGCSASAQQAVVVNGTPNINASTNKPLVCSGFPATLTASGGQSYSWDTGASGSAITVNPAQTTVYTVTGTAQNGCTSTKTVQVNVFSPVIGMPLNPAACLGGSVTLTATGANTYTWTGNQPFQSITVYPTSSTIYTVSATSQSNGVSCVSTNTVLVTISPNPTVLATASTTLVCKGAKLTLNATGAASYVWSNAATTPSTSVTPLAQTVYTVTGTDANGCFSTASITVKISTCIGFNEYELMPANKLHMYPNPSSGVVSISSEFTMDVYLINELGQVIRKIELNEQNSHKTEIRDLAAGTYFMVDPVNHLQLRDKLIIQK